MIEVEIEDAAWSAALPEATALVERAATAALGRVEGDLVVLLTDNATVGDASTSEVDHTAVGINCRVVGAVAILAPAVG